MLQLAACSNASAPEPGPATPPTNLPPGVDAPSNAHGESPELVAVGATGGCSGAIIDVGGPPDAPAYALTAGHCIGPEHWNANDIHLDLPADELGSFSANTFYESYGAWIDFPLARIEYATMHLRDVTVLRLTATNAEVLARGVVPMRVARETAAPGEAIAIVGHPNGDSLRRSRCENGINTYLAEDEFMFHEISNECADIAPGSSGSPVLNAAGEIFGLVSTGSGEERPCSLDNPCDLSQADLVNPASPTVYIADAAGLGACFVDGRFELNAPDCPLTKPTLTNAQRRIGRYVQSRPDALASWDVNMAESGLPYYRFKSGTAHEIRCDDEAGYGPAQPVATLPTIAEPVPGQEGLYLMCVEGGASADSFAPADSAFSLLTEVDDTPPQAPSATEVFSDEGKYGTLISIAVNGRDFSKIYYRMQLPLESDCARTPTDIEATKYTSFVVEPGDLRQELCLTVEDAAGNRSAAARLDAP